MSGVRQGGLLRGCPVWHVGTRAGPRLLLSALPPGLLRRWRRSALRLWRVGR